MELFMADFNRVLRAIIGASVSDWQKRSMV
jgi:hypothetical protein